MRPVTPITATILKVLESRSRPGTLVRADVQCSEGVLSALFGPGMYRILPVDSVKPGDEVLLSMEPVPTILGLVKDG